VQVSYLETLEPDVSEAAKRFLETGKADVIDRTKTSGFVVVPYNARAVPTVTCKANEFCTIELEPGEFVKEKNGWYLADEVRWMAYPLEYGEGESAVQTILLKPLDSLPYLRTSIQIGTNRRPYTIDVVSGTKTTRKLKFWYPQDIVRRFHEMALAQYAQAKTIAARGLQVDLHSIHTNYRLECHGARFCPSFVGDDGQRTFILLPSGLEALGLPALLIERSGEQMIPNVRFDSLPWITVDGLFDRAQIRYGADKNQPVVDITRVA
jgi:P-type conjugative transfer protein TrbG